MRLCFWKKFTSKVVIVSMGWETILRLALAMLMGGLIGLERELINRPAGFRTHTLVCMGAALVMTTSEYLFHNYYQFVNLDPARLGAQVVSGIGFLGAGSIINDGHRVRGLTTAASLWVVACIGLAVGAGFYIGAISAFIMCYITLISLKRFEHVIEKRRGNVQVVTRLKNMPGEIGKVTSVLGRFRVHIVDIEVEDTDDEFMRVMFFVSLPPVMDKDTLIAELERVEGVKVERE